jgi:hypothetical protein
MSHPFPPPTSFHAAVSIGISDHAVDASLEDLVAPDPSVRQGTTRNDSGV